MARMTHFLPAFLCVSLIAACGGGGGGSSGTTRQETTRLSPSPFQNVPSSALREAPNTAKSSNLAASAALIDLLQDRETFCLRRAFHCGTGLPWTDAAPFLKNQEIEASGKINLNWRF